MNTVSLIGRIEKNLTFVNLEKKSLKMADFTLSVKNGSYTDSIECRIFGKLATVAYEYLKEGSRVAIQGWLNKHKDTTRVIVKYIRFLDRNGKKVI